MPRLIRLSLLLLVALVLGIVLVGVILDRSQNPPMDFEPNRESSALDLEGIVWPEAAPEPELAAPEPATPEPAAPEPSEEGGLESFDEPSVAMEPCAAPQPADRWMVIGWDGADWQMILPLLREGRLPNLEKLMRGGSYGTLASIVPTISPAIWTTVATGTSPGEHGILHFYNQQPVLTRWWQRIRNFGELKRELYTNADRRRHAIWNLASEKGRRVMTVGYHNTFPVEPIDGLMVSNYLVQDSVAQAMNMEAGDEKNDLASSLVYPMEHLPKVLDIQKEVNRKIPDIAQRFADIPDAELTDFLRASRRIPEDGDQKPYFLIHAWLFDQIVAEVADAYLSQIQPDLAMIHFQAVDWASHRFLYYHSPELYEDRQWSPEVRSRLEADMDRYGETVDRFYVYLDEWLGKLLAHRDERTAVLLMSDHGFAAGEDPDITGGHDHAPPGILVLNGPGIRRDHQLSGADIYDVMPTLMAGLGLAVAEDLPGEVLSAAVCENLTQTVETVATYSTGAPYVPEISRPAELDQELLQQMKSLGYIQ